MWVTRSEAETAGLIEAQYRLFMIGSGENWITRSFNTIPLVTRLNMNYPGS
jgi:hypothetical protein